MMDNLFISNYAFYIAKLCSSVYHTERIIIQGFTYAIIVGDISIADEVYKLIYFIALYITYN